MQNIHIKIIHRWLLSLLMVLGMTGFALAQAPGQNSVRFTESTAIQSLDGGQSWHLASGELSEVPAWAQAWLNAEKPAQKGNWSPQGATLKLANGAALTATGTDGAWQLEAGERAALPGWANHWLGGETVTPIRQTADFPPVKALCGSENPVQRTRNLQLGPDLAIRSYDDGRTWAMAKGAKADLPDWVRPWLEREAPATQPAKELTYGDALIRSVDGGNSWTLIEGELEDLPAWVRPWLDDKRAAIAAAPLNKAATTQAQFDLFPNPTKGKAVLRFELLSEEEARVDLYDLQGRLIRTLVAGTLPQGMQEIEINVAHLAAGSYFVRFSTASQQARLRLMVAQ